MVRGNPIHGFNVDLKGFQLLQEGMDRAAVKSFGKHLDERIPELWLRQPVVLEEEPMLLVQRLVIL
ncbi:hypothetical protein KFK09_013371 [Dendrobium nobile]|uniref:Uncharacterized protein n=1 Tax=Dendrobium nobile TaxID=94219 RepID=A0A8T3BCW7_DENNO|nr:hypothetical protein KFK09_013371 [Dendrobium nobile]